MKAATLVALGLICLAQLSSAAEDHWPQWRGPSFNGTSPSATPPLRWGEKQNIRWKIQVPGRGMSTPVVWGDKIFLTTALRTEKLGQPPTSPDGKGPATIPAAMNAMFSLPPQSVYEFVVLCLDRTTGKTLWQKVAKEAVPHERHHRDGSYASPSPVTDGKGVVAFFGSRGLFCYDMEGNLKWQKDLGRMRIRMTFGEGSSPALWGDTLVVNWDHEGEDFIAAFNLEDGRELWRQPRDENSSWATPLIVEHDGKRQVISSATARVRGYDLATGKPLWECAGMTINVIPSPVHADGLVYAISGFRGSSLLAIRLGKTGDLTKTGAIAWEHHKNTPYVPSPVLSGQRLYFFDGNKAVLTCLDAKTGKPHYAAKDVEGLEGIYASPIAAGGRVYLVGRNGATAVIKDADTFEVLATNKLDDSFTASPVAVGRQLLLRGLQNLYCIEEDKP